MARSIFVGVVVPRRPKYAVSLQALDNSLAASPGPAPPEPSAAEAKSGNKAGPSSTAPHKPVEVLVIPDDDSSDNLPEIVVKSPKRKGKAKAVVQDSDDARDAGVPQAEDDDLPLRVPKRKVTRTYSTKRVVPITSSDDEDASSESEAGPSRPTPARFPSKPRRPPSTSKQTNALAKRIARVERRSDDESDSQTDEGFLAPEDNPKSKAKWKRRRSGGSKAKTASKEGTGKGKGKELVGKGRKDAGGKKRKGKEVAKKRRRDTSSDSATSEDFDLSLDDDWDVIQRRQAKNRKRSKPDYNALREARKQKLGSVDLSTDLVPEASGSKIRPKFALPKEDGDPESPDMTSSSDGSKDSSEDGSDGEPAAGSQTESDSDEENFIVHDPARPNKAVRAATSAFVDRRQGQDYHLQEYLSWMVHELCCPEHPFLDPAYDERYLPSWLYVEKLIEGVLSSLLSSSLWTTDFRRMLNNRPGLEIDLEGAVAKSQCEACNHKDRARTTAIIHKARYDRRNFGGIHEDDLSSGHDSDPDDDGAREAYCLGPKCAERARDYHYLRHWGWRKFHELSVRLDRIKLKIAEKPPKPKGKFATPEAMALYKKRKKRLTEQRLADAERCVEVLDKDRVLPIWASSFSRKLEEIRMKWSK